MSTRVRSSLRYVVALLLAASFAGVTRADAPFVHAVNSPSLGPILTNPEGFTLYHLVLEQNGHVVCTGACVRLWPPYTVPAGTTIQATLPGISGTFSLVTRPDGLGQQVAYDGDPLYTFAHDTAPGQTNGENFKNLWFAASANAVPLAASRTMLFSLHVSRSGASTGSAVNLRFRRGSRSVATTCRATCSFSVPGGTRVHLRAVLANGATFLGWRARDLDHGSILNQSSQHLTLVARSDFRVTARFSS